MNKSTLNTILITVAVMLVLFKVATKFDLIGNKNTQNTSWNNNKKANKNSYKPNRAKGENPQNTVEQKTDNNQPAANNNAIAHNATEAQNLHLLDHERKIILTKHAKCRMDCRHFTNEEIKEILQKGTINFAKSNDREGTCPTYAIEGETSDGQSARMVFAFCDYNSAKVITVIDLDTDWECNCY